MTEMVYPKTGRGLWCNTV